jgi:hypothetical protein
MSRLLRAAPVVWLIALIALPCTAPFSTCELADLFPSDRAPERRSPRPLDLSADRALPHSATAGRGTARVRHPRAMSSSTAPQLAVHDRAGELARVMAAPRHPRAPHRRILRI